MTSNGTPAYRSADRAIVIVLDSVGCGAAPDADRFGDVGAATLQNVAKAVGGLSLPNLGRWGLGNIVEMGTAEQVYFNPRHPYTKALISAVPHPDPRGDGAGRIVLEGDIPTPLAKPSGCGFRTRCPMAQPSCAENVPTLKDRGEGHLVACPLVDGS